MDGAITPPYEVDYEVRVLLDGCEVVMTRMMRATLFMCALPTYSLLGNRFRTS
jgi:hypothetical protein